MRVIVNCRFLTQPITGVQRFAEEITKRLPQELSDVTLVAPDESLRHEELGGVPVERIGRLHGHLWEQIELPRYVRSHSGFLLSLANTGPIGLREQLAVIHDITWARMPQSYSRGFRLWYRFMTGRLVRRARALATVSEFSREDIASYWGIDPARFTVVPNAVDEAFLARTGIEPRGVPHGAFLLSVASQAPHKNIPALVEAYHLAAAETAMPPLVLVGGSSRAFVPTGAVAETQHGPGQIIALGRVDDEELVWLYRHATAFVFPSLYEGFGIPPLEALACGCPVISSNAASLPEVLGDSAKYFDPRDQRAMAQALIDAAGWPLEGAQRRARTGTTAFRWERSAREIVHASSLTTRGGTA